MTTKEEQPTKRVRGAFIEAMTNEYAVLNILILLAFLICFGLFLYGIFLID